MLFHGSSLIFIAQILCLFTRSKKSWKIILLLCAWLTIGIESKGQPRQLSSLRDTTALASYLLSLDDSLAMGRDPGLSQRIRDLGRQMKGKCQRCESVIHYLNSYILVDKDEYDSAIMYANLALRQGKGADLPLFKPKVLLVLSKIYRRKGDCLKAVNLCNQLREEIEPMKSLSLVAKINMELSYNYWMLDDFSQSLKFLYENLKMSDQLNDPLLYATVYNVLGLNLVGKGDMPASIGQFRKSLKTLGSVSPVYREKVIFNMGETYGKMDMLDQADSCLQISLHLCDSLKLRKALAGTYQALGDLELKRNNLSKAMNYHRRSLHIYREFYMSHEGVTALIAVGNDYYTRGQYQPALEAYREAADISLKRHFLSGAENALQGLAKVYIAMGRLREAFDAEQLRNDLYKKQLDTERSRQQSLYEARHELKKKEEMNSLLTANNELIRKEVEAQKRENWFYFTVIILMTVITLIVLFGFLAKQKLSRKLKMQNLLIEEQKEELSTSLDFVKKTQSQLLFSEKMASLGILTAGVAHELNNPLNFVSSGVGVLTDLVKDVLQLLKQPQQPSQEAIEKLEKNMDGILESVYDGVDRASKIIRDLNTFSSPKEYEFTDIDVCQPIEMALTLLNKKIQDGHIYITRSYDHGSRCVRGNASQLSQVFMNIIDNAIQALETKADDRQIIITTHTDPTSVEIIIEDNGPGIPPEIQTRIMEPFYTTKPVGKGSGLGLYISYDIIKNHWGRFSVSSMPGSTTAFRISLDVVSASPERKKSMALESH